VGKKSAPPPAPDYAAAAEKTGASNQAAQTRADWTNRPNQITPWGTQSWTSQAEVDPSSGQPITSWTQNTTLSPQSQAALDSQMALDTGKSQLAQSFMGRVADDYSKPFDMSGLPDRAGSPQTGLPGMGGDISSGVGDASRQRVEQGLLDRLRPEQQFQTEALETKLVNQGLTPGSKAYDRAKQAQGDQFSRDQFNALMMGGQEQMNQFNMAKGAGEYANQQNQQQFGQNLQSGNFQNQNRQQAIAEQALRRGMSLNEMNALLTGTQVGMPSMPSFNTSNSAGGVNYSGAADSQYNAAMNAYNAKQQQQQGMMSGLTGLASTAMMFSDSRLKSNIVRVGDHPLGVGVYEYDIFGRRERGVLAQELLKVAPQRVHVHQSGFFMVDYRGL
jgi:hypothetical protein